MGNKSQPYYIICMLLLLTACSLTSFESKEALLTYIADEKNGYCQKKKVQGVEYTMTYRPTDLVVANEWNVKADQEKLNYLRKKYEPHAYFNLSISKGGRELLTNVVGNKEKYSSLLRAMSFGMQQIVTITNEVKDTIPILDFISPRMYELDGRNTTMLIVDKSQPGFTKAKQLKIAVGDIGFGTGEVSFYFDKDKLINQPNINFKSNINKK